MGALAGDVADAIHDDGEHAVRAAAALIHLSLCHSPIPCPDIHHPHHLFTAAHIDLRESSGLMWTPLHHIHGCKVSAKVDGTQCTASVSLQVTAMKLAIQQLLSTPRHPHGDLGMRAVIQEKMNEVV